MQFATSNLKKKLVFWLNHGIIKQSPHDESVYHLVTDGEDINQAEEEMKHNFDDENIETSVSTVKQDEAEIQVKNQNFIVLIYLYK